MKVRIQGISSIWVDVQGSDRLIHTNGARSVRDGGRTDREASPREEIEHISVCRDDSSVSEREVAPMNVHQINHFSGQIKIPRNRAGKCSRSRRNVV